MPQKNKIFIVLGAVALFFAYAWFPLNTGDLWNAPDESAAAFFAERLPIVSGEYDVPAAYSNELGGIVHPRSVNVVDGQLVPNMWLGLPWTLGIVRRVTGLEAGSLDLVIPLVAVLAILAWQQVVLRFMRDPLVAWFAAIALAVHPGWWYFTARGLHPNVLFVSMLIFSAYFWYVAKQKPFRLKKDIWSELMMLAGGLSFGMAIFVRTNAAIWLVPILLVVAWKARRLPFREIAAGLVGLLIPIVIMLQLNVAIFGSALTTGYSVAVDPAVAQVAAESDIIAESSIMQYIFPFGIHEMNVVRNFFDFHFAFFALWTFFALYGFALILFRWKKLSFKDRDIGAMVTAVVFVAAYLVLLYGSWNLNDNPDPTAVTIGTSYIRYWLPITVMMTPLIGYAIATGFARGRTQARKTILMIIWIGALVISGIHVTYLGQDEGLQHVVGNIAEFEVERVLLLDKTGSDDLLIVDRSDKIIFPQRSVVVSLRDETTYASLPIMMDAVEQNGASLYYYGITLPIQDLDFLHETRLTPVQIQMQAVEQVGEKTLYIFSRE